MKKTQNPKNLYMVGESWIVEFVSHGQRYRENIGPVSRTVAKETAARRKAAAAEGRLEVGRKVEDPLFEKACQRYLDWYKAHSRPGSYQRHQTSAVALKAYFSGKRLSQIGAFTVEAFKLKRKKDGRADATVNREIVMIKHLFAKAVEWKLAKANPLTSVKLFREDNGRTRYLSHAEAQTLLAACSPELRLVVLAALHTGLRKSELSSLTWGCVDMLNRSITVESAYAKNHDTRSVPLTDDLFAALQSLRAKRSPAPSDPVFVSRYGKPWKSWRTAFDNALEKAGISGFRFHDLRHTYGSWLAMQGVIAEGRMDLMGHRTPSMTLRYTHLSMDYKREAVGRLPALGETESPQISPSREIGIPAVAAK